MTNIQETYYGEKLVAITISAETLEKGLMRVAELIDKHISIVVAISHYSLMTEADHSLDFERLGKLMGVRICLEENLPKVLSEVQEGNHVDELSSHHFIEHFGEIMHERMFRHVHVNYGQDVERSIDAMIQAMAAIPIFRDAHSKRYYAVRLLERPNAILPEISAFIHKHNGTPDNLNAIEQQAARERSRLLIRYGQTATELILHAREGFVHGALEETLTHAKNDTGHSLADKVDKVLTNKWLGFPILAAILYLVFECTFVLGAYPQTWISNGLDALCNWLYTVLPPAWWANLITEGVIRGVGTVVAFLPNIIILFFFICIMEDSGYMARAAYLMDKIMHKIGLHGKSFIPMLIGFGCNVPAILAAKDIENKKDRTLTMLMIPFMSCSARLPVYMLFISAFFAHYQGLIMISLYLLGIVLSICFALIMKRTKWFRKPEEDFVSELPAIHFPVMRGTFVHIWERVKDYLKKITTVVLWASIIIWFLSYYPTHSLETSYLAAVGHWLEPLMMPLGFDWKMAVCLLTGLPAKEAIVSTMGILYQGATFANFTQTTAYAFMVFVLLYFPCISTISTLRKEIGRKWALFTVVHSLLLAWIFAWLINLI